ncbi:MAG: hypothetical protein HQK89_04570, partial [Nitrospirae bacterium]|nr:hypothetical protein [Nitrospirota bacterium]
MIKLISLNPAKYYQSALLPAVRVILFLIMISLVNAMNTGAATIYFYSAELNVESFNALKGYFDSYLSRYGNYVFQPFIDKDTFEK